MKAKQSAIGVLVAVNLLLLAALVMGSLSLPTAIAQIGGAGGGFACVTAKAAGQTYYVLYVVDVATTQMYGFYPVPGRKHRLATSQPRDLTADFQR